jgi:F1F0 ATPase subunit 2
MLIDFGNNLWLSGLYSLLVGGVLGAFYFTGLWLTVRRLDSTPYIGILLLCSMLLRISVVMLGFYLLLDKNWHSILLALLGFILVRLFAIRRIRSKESSVINKEIQSLKQKSLCEGE